MKALTTTKTANDNRPPPTKGEDLLKLLIASYELETGKKWKPKT